MRTHQWRARLVGVGFAALIGVGLGASAAAASPARVADCPVATAAYPPPACPTVSFSSSEFYPGGTVSLTVAGFQPDEGVSIILHSAPVVVGAAAADAGGVLTASFSIPLDFPTGAHTLILQGAAGTTVTQAFGVTAAPGTTATGLSGGAAGTTTAATGGASSALPFTGADVVGLAGGGLALLVGGGTLRVAARRRH